MRCQACDPQYATEAAEATITPRALPLNEYRCQSVRPEPRQNAIL